MTPFSATERQMVIRLFELLDVLVEWSLTGVPMRPDRARDVLDQAAACRRVLLVTALTRSEDDEAAAAVPTVH